MSDDPIIYKVSDGCLEITLNRPNRLNSFNETMHKAMAKAIKLAAGDDIRSVLITGAGRGFCAGQDLNDRVFSEGEIPDLGETLDAYYNPLIKNIRNLNKPVICAVNGVAAGAGANIALACDIVLAAKSAKFIQAFCKIGLIPDSGGTYILPKLIGEARAKALMLLGTPIMADQAKQWGMILDVVDDDALMDKAREMAKFLATQPTIGLGLTKQAIQAASDNNLETHLEFEKQCQRQAGRSDDYRIGVKAFFAKQKPEFTGQ
ncbi:MAG: 2-(1,2-epoxy-1,2-dihydrophenyl)acetyl-CoA isomerase [Rhizobiales bacterium]|nr:2-(1,2-epoxy-1,2-dihydrophenyl)acetyl-CoA isomerase [Hyphomicrobiales bacterium]